MTNIYFVYKSHLAHIRYVSQNGAYVGTVTSRNKYRHTHLVLWQSKTRRPGNRSPSLSNDQKIPCTESSVSIVTRLRAGRPGFDSRQGLGISLLVTVSRQVLEPTQPPIQRVPGVLSPQVNRPGLEAEHSPPSVAYVKNTPPIRLHGMVLS
jgi:hypothetical protein